MWGFERGDALDGQRSLGRFSSRFGIVAALAEFEEAEGTEIFFPEMHGNAEKRIQIASPRQLSVLRGSALKEAVQGDSFRRLVAIGERNTCARLFIAETLRTLR